MPNIYHAVLIGASADKVYEAISTEDGLRAWWTPKAKAETAVNEFAQFPFGNGYYKEMKILALRPSKSVEWTCVRGDQQWIDTTLSFKLEAGDPGSLLQAHPEVQGQVEQQTFSGNATLLHFHHDNWKEYSLMFAECSYTWALFLRSLKLFCETGKGRPWPDQHKTENS